MKGQAGCVGGDQTLGLLRAMVTRSIQNLGQNSSQSSMHPTIPTMYLITWSPKDDRYIWLATVKPILEPGGAGHLHLVNVNREGASECLECREKPTYTVCGLSPTGQEFL